MPSCDLVGTRALLGAAAASVIQEAPVDELEAEGLFTFIKDAATNYGPTVIKQSPVVFDALRLIIHAYAGAYGRTNGATDLGVHLSMEINLPREISQIKTVAAPCMTRMGEGAEEKSSNGE